MRDAIPFDDVLSLKEVDLYLAFGPTGLIPTRGEADVDPVETALRLADRSSRMRRGRRSLPTLLYSLTLASEDLEERAEALGISREVTGPPLHLLGPRLVPAELLAGLGEWAREDGLRLLIVDASGADPDEVAEFVASLRDFAEERGVYAVLLLPATEHRDGREEDDDGR